MEVKIKKFDMSRVADDKVVVCIGRRGTGKSWAVRDLLSRHTTIPTGIVISPTEQANRFFGAFVPSLLIHDEYSPAIVENVLKRQKSIVQMNGRERQGGARDPVDPRAFVVLDDCNYDKTWLNDPNIRYLFMNGRHVKIFFILTMQYSLGLPPCLRTNVDFAFIFRETNVQNRRRLYENYAGCIPSFEVFNSILNECTQGNDFLVIDNTATTNNLTDQVFWYNAASPPDFRMCAEPYWTLSHQVAQRADGREEDQTYDLDKLRKVGSRLRVSKRS